MNIKELETFLEVCFNNNNNMYLPLEVQPLLTFLDDTKGCHMPSGKTVVVCAPPGAGKTALFHNVTHEMREEGNNIEFSRVGCYTIDRMQSLLFYPEAIDLLNDLHTFILDDSIYLFKNRCLTDMFMSIRRKYLSNLIFLFDCKSSYPIRAFEEASIKIDHVFSFSYPPPEARWAFAIRYVEEHQLSISIPVIKALAYTHQSIPSLTGALLKKDFQKRT